MSNKGSDSEGSSAGDYTNSTKIQLQGFPFPYSIRELGASIELVKFEGAKESELASWARENAFGLRTNRAKDSSAKKERRSDSEDGDWGIISEARSQKKSSGASEETMFLALSFQRVVTAHMKLQNGRIERVEEEVTEPEVSEFHARHRDGFLELYSFGSKQRNMLIRSLMEAFGEDSLAELYLTKDAMKSLMAEAIEVTSVSLTGLGNPFFSDASFTGTDPANSKTYKELLGSGEIKSFRAKFQTSSAASEDASSSLPLALGVTSSRCKLRFYGGRSPVAQSDIEDFAGRVANIASISSSTNVEASSINRKHGREGRSRRNKEEELAP